MRSLEDMVMPAGGIAFYAAGWITTHTAVPSEWRVELSGVLLVVGCLGVVAAARVAGVDIDGGRCRATKKTDGERCTLSRGPGEDLCHVHQNVHDVTVHPSAIDGAVPESHVAAEGDSDPRKDI